MKRLLLAFFLTGTLTAYANLSDVPVNTQTIPEVQIVDWLSPDKTVTAGQQIVVAIRDTDGTTVLESKVFTIPTGKTFTGRMQIHGELQ